MSRAGRRGGSTGADAFAEELTGVGPGSAVAGIEEQELAVLRQVGGGSGWARVRRGCVRYRSIRVCIGSRARSEPTAVAHRASRSDSRPAIVVLMVAVGLSYRQLIEA